MARSILSLFSLSLLAMQPLAQQWVSLETVPVGRTSAASAADPRTGRMLMLGGTAASGSLSFTGSDVLWQWTGQSWVRRGEGVAPVGRTEAAMALDTARGRVVRFSGCAPARIAIEAGTHSPWAHALLAEVGHEVLVANPRKVRAIYNNDKKCDRVDAEQLARFARMDPKLLSPITHRGEAARADLAVLRSRSALVDARTQLINHVRGSIKPFGVRLSGCSTSVFATRAAWQIPRELRRALVPILRTIADLTTRIAKFERRIERLGNERYPETKRLRQVDGVGAITSLTFLLTLEDPTRFGKSRAVGAFLGLRPGRSQSGKGDPELRITKAGDRDVRRLLVQSAQYILGPFGKDSDLRRFGLALAARSKKSAKKRALIAVARKLAVLLHRLWLSGSEYDPLRHAEGRNQARRRRA